MNEGHEGEGGDWQHEGMNGFGRSFLYALFDFALGITAPTLGGIVVALVALAFVGVPAAAVSFATLTIVVSGALGAVAGVLLKKLLVERI